MKLKHIMIVAAVALLAACTNQDSLLKKFEKACEKGDVEKATKIMEEMEEKYPDEADWTIEQQARIINASLILQEKAYGDIEDAFNALEDLDDFDY